VGWGGAESYRRRWAGVRDALIRPASGCGLTSGSSREAFSLFFFFVAEIATELRVIPLRRRCRRVDEQCVLLGRVSPLSSKAFPRAGTVLFFFVSGVDITG